MNHNDNVPATMVDMQELRAKIQRAKSPNKATQQPPAAAAYQPPPAGDAVSSVTDDTPQPPAKAAASGNPVNQQSNNNNENKKEKNQKNQEKVNKKDKKNHTKPTDSRLESAMPTIESQPKTMQPALTQATLRMLKLHESLVNKKTGNLKLETDKDLIPNSVRLKPELQVVKHLQHDEESIRNKARFKEILAKTQQDLKDVMIRQNKRQIKVMTEKLLAEFNKIIVDLSTLYVRYITTKSEVTLATLVPPVIAAAATHCLFFCLEPNDELFRYLGSNKDTVLEHNKTKYLTKTNGIPIVGGIDNLFTRKSNEPEYDTLSAEEKEEEAEEEKEEENNEHEEEKEETKENDPDDSNTAQPPQQPPPQIPATTPATAAPPIIQFRNPYAQPTAPRRATQQPRAPGTIPNPATRGTPRTADTLRRAQEAHQPRTDGFVPANTLTDTAAEQTGQRGSDSIPGPTRPAPNPNAALLTPEAANPATRQEPGPAGNHEDGQNSTTGDDGNPRADTHSPARLTFEGTPLYDADPPYLSQKLLSLVHKISMHLAALLEPLFLDPPKELKETTLEKKALLDVAEGIKKQRAHARGRDLSLALAEPAVADHPSMTALIDSRLDTKTKQQKNRERKQRLKEQKKTQHGKQNDTNNNRDNNNDDQNQSKNESEGGWGTPVDPAIAARATVSLREPADRRPIQKHDTKRAATVDLTALPPEQEESPTTMAPRHGKRPRFTEEDYQAFLDFQERRAANPNPYSTSQHQPPYQGGRAPWGQRDSWDRGNSGYHYTPRGRGRYRGRGRGRGFYRGRGRGQGHYNQHPYGNGGDHDDMSNV